MKAFVTGGTGFIGEHLVQRLLEKGYDVYALVRSGNGAEKMKAMGAVPVYGDITQRASMVEGMRGSDVVFHVAAWYKIGSNDWQQAEEINVQGTQNVLRLAYELGVPKILYTSTIAVFGDTHGRLVDESYIPPAGPFPSEYDRTKWMAHYRVAVPLIEQGAPVIIVMPGVVFGPGDNSLVGEMMVRYYKGQFPIFPAPELTLTFAHVDDIVEGHILAAEKGRPGESYILAGPALPMKDMVKVWSAITGHPAPLIHIPPQLIKPFAPLMQAISSVIPLPSLVSRETIEILDFSYIATADKAREQLGWKTRPLVDGMRQTFEWIAESSAPQPLALTSARRRQAAALALGLAAGAFLIWLVARRKSSRSRK